MLNWIVTEQIMIYIDIYVFEEPAHITSHYFFSLQTLISGFHLFK